MTFLITILLCVFTFLPLSHSSGGHHWNYKHQDPAGPSNWQHHCNGEHQSPINIPDTGLTSVTFPPLSLSDYDLMPDMAILRNNGHSAKLSTKPTTPEVIPIMSGGGLPHSYKFSQVHFHWGLENDRGSEHLLGNTSFPMEMHLVHYKSSHSSIKEALEESAHDSLAVLAVFFQVSDKPNPGLAGLLPHMDKIVTAETEAVVDTFPISNFLTGDMSSFYRYSGSLTTPACNEIVQWTVMKDPVSMSEEQIKAFRQLLTTESEPLGDNYRPVQKVGDREVWEVTTAIKLRSGHQQESGHSHAVRILARENVFLLGIVMMILGLMASL